VPCAMHLNLQLKSGVPAAGSYCEVTEMAACCLPAVPGQQAKLVV
jgi:hypothetical protein